MASLVDLAESRRPAYNFSVDKLKIKPGFNARNFDDPKNVAHLEEIVESMRVNGFDEDKPIAIFKVGDDVFVADGEFRLRAARIVGINIVPCIPVPGNRTEVDLILGQNRANLGKRFEPLEAARNFALARDTHKMSVEEIAKKAGCSPTHVRNLLDLHDAPDPIKDLVAEGTVSTKMAVKTIREGEEAIETLAEAAEAAKEAGKSKVQPKDVDTSESRDRKSSSKGVKDFLKRLAKYPDPLEADDFDQAIRDFADFINEAKELKKTV